MRLCCAFLMGFFILCCGNAKGQLGFDLDIKKPEPYQNREVKAEKTPSKPIKGPKKLFQNATTHFNYVFNANTKLNEIVSRAKAAHKDDYTKTLPFYNYSLQAIAPDAANLDSIIAKSKTGIVLHDLRNDWIDDLYLLWGASYYFQQHFDSAYNMFQFINYAFAEKEKDGYYRYIGSRMDGNNGLSITSKENNSLLKRAISEPPARNDAFIWQVRTLIQQGAYPEAGSLITTLRNDPNFPSRLLPALEEVHSLWFYNQGFWDSAAHHLVKALPQAKTAQEKARWEYLAAQLFEKKGALEEAKAYYNKSIQHTTDPVMEVYARLNLVRLNRDGIDNNYIDRNIADLLKMARREKYEMYRNIIYSMIARMELERGNFIMAQGYLIKASKYKGEDAASNNEAYLEVADLLYAQRNYKMAAAFYDSVQLNAVAPEVAQRIGDRKPLLAQLLTYTTTIERQDSLQRIASLPEEERSDYVKKLVRQLRRQQGLNEEAAAPVFNSPAPTDPFEGKQAKGEWYFYNESLRKTGAATFRQVWGARPNVDNWRRQSDVAAQLRSNVAENTRTTAAKSGNTSGDPLTFEAMMEGLPLTAEKLQTSMDSIQGALFSLGTLYLNELEDYPAAIEAFEQIRSRFKQIVDEDLVLFNLYYAYIKAGNAAKGGEIKRLMLARYPSSRYTAIVNTGIDPKSSKPTTEVTKTYEAVYDLFLEGRFEEAQAAKQQADSVYGTNHWSPQLLYIEAVYQIKQSEDSLAKQTLGTLVQQHAGSPLAAKAQTLLDVLGRRQQIEEELRALQIERPQEDTFYVEPMPAGPLVQKRTSVAPPSQPRDTAAPLKVTPSREAVAAVKPVPVKDTVALPKPATKKDSALAVSPPAPKKDTALAVAKPSPKIDTARVVSKPVPKKDTAVIVSKPVPKKDTAVAASKPAPPKRPADTLAKAPVVKQEPNSPYRYKADVAHYGVVVLNKVDIVFGNEARNAFVRFTQHLSTRPLQGRIVQLNENIKLLLLGEFATASAAIEYIQNVKPIAATQVVPWLKSDKYTFSIISEENLKAVLDAKDFAAYQKFIEQTAPVKF